MRLICGVFHLDGRPADPHRLARMLDALRPASVASHRAVHVEGAIALGRLSVRAADEGECLPRGPGGLVLAADSRLDATGPGSPGDDAPLLAALDSPESGALGRLLGDFAVAAWDPRQGRLTCARDGMGIRPLFYVHRPGDVFAVASRPAALLAGGFAAPDLDLTFIARTLMRAECEPDLSLFTGIRRVAPGTSLRVTRGRLETRVEWRLSADLIGRGPAEPEEAAVELRRLVAEAVRCRLPAQGPVATDLSGGLDSSSITLLAADAIGDPGRVVAASFLPRDADPTDAQTEWPYVNAVRARLPGLDWAPIHAADGFAFLRPEMGRDHLRPVDPAGAPIQTIARARARGADRLLSGWGGDEGASFNGRGVFAEALVRGRWRYLAAELPPYAAARDIGVWRAARGEILPHLIGARTLHGLRRLAGRPDTSPAGSGTARMLAPHLRASAGSPPPLPRCRSGAIRLALLGGPGIGRRCEESNLLGADHGVSLLFPMLDRRVVEFALSLPGDLFLREGKRRWIYRRAMADLLPERIAERRTKLMPIQNAAEIIRAGAGEAARWIGGLADDPRLTACLDTAAILREVTDLAATPPEVPIDARLDIKNVLHVAAFLEQHG